MASRPGVKNRPPQPLPPRHVPQRTCIGCRTAVPKRDLVRIVRTSAGHVEVDPTGKKAGRGAYFHRDPGCLKEGLLKGRLARALHVNDSEEAQTALKSIIHTSLMLSTQADTKVSGTAHLGLVPPKEAMDGTKNNPAN